MRARFFVVMSAATGLLLVTGGASSIAENDTQLTRDPTLQRGRGFFSFGQTPAQRATPPRQRIAPALPRRSGAAAVREDTVIPKLATAHRVLVLGDSLAELVGSGLDDALNDRPDIAVLRRAKPDSGLARADYHDWPKAATELLASEPTVHVGVMLLGLNDRQPIREGETAHEPLSPRWIDLYRARIAAVVGAFAAKRVPLIWVGLPPVQNSRLSADLVSLNAAYRQEVEAAGGTYVDLWGGFVDAENRYAATGPDVSGQSTRLRLGDGIHFTAAGARKAAHFVDVAIRRLIEVPSAQSGAVALPVGPDRPGVPDPGALVAAELQPGGIERLIDGMVGNQPALGLSSQLRARPAAGPVQSLTGQAPVGEAVLLGSIADLRGRNESSIRLDRIVGEGSLPEPKPGRLDDARWPR